MQPAAPTFAHDWHGDAPYVSCRKCWNMHPDYWAANNAHPERAYHEPTNPKCVVPDRA